MHSPRVLLDEPDDPLVASISLRSKRSTSSSLGPFMPNSQVAVYLLLDGRRGSEAQPGSRRRTVRCQWVPIRYPPNQRLQLLNPASSSAGCSSFREGCSLSYPGCYELQPPDGQENSSASVRGCRRLESITYGPRCDRPSKNNRGPRIGRPGDTTEPRPYINVIDRIHTSNVIEPRHSGNVHVQ